MGRWTGLERAIKFNQSDVPVQPKRPLTTVRQRSRTLLSPKTVTQHAKEPCAMMTLTWLHDSTSQKREACRNVTAASLMNYRVEKSTVKTVKRDRQLMRQSKSVRAGLRAPVSSPIWLFHKNQVNSFVFIADAALSEPSYLALSNVAQLLPFELH